MGDSSGEARRLPALVAHADWSAHPRGQWLATARLVYGRYAVSATEPAGDPRSLLERLAGIAGDEGRVLVGFDFPIGLPRRYAELAGIDEFRDFLRRVEEGEWRDFYRVAEHPEEISLRRPFYPRRPGGTAHVHLVEALGFERMDELRRRCDRAHPHRRAASPIFWTLGGAQVGRAAISGWRDVLAPVFRARTDVVALWPFDGPLAALLARAPVVVAETYPSEYHAHLGIQVRSKREVRERVGAGRALARWAAGARVDLAEELRAEIERGFDHDDAFDAAVGLFGMLNVVLGRRPSGEPRDDEAVARVEGWILGQQARDL